MEQLEHHARNVFNALYMVRRCVILFDEFEPILRRREASDISSDSVFSFLTPGMLPKLQRLNEHAKEHRLVYALTTNLIGTLDEAAIRPGRFDVKLGVYPPDLLSRTGRIVSQLAGMEDLAPEWRDRLAELVYNTSEGPMTTLAQPGWFTADLKGRWRLSRTALRYVVSGEGHPNLKTISDKEWPETPYGENRYAEREWEEWRWVVHWDRSLRVPTWNALCSALEERPMIVRWSPKGKR